VAVADLEIIRRRGCLMLNKFNSAFPSGAAAIFCHLISLFKQLANATGDPALKGFLDVSETVYD